MSRKVYHDNRAERIGGTDAEPLYRCGGCLREGFTMRGMNSHVCRPAGDDKGTRGPGGKENAPVTRSPGHPVTASSDPISHPAGETASTQPKKDKPDMSKSTTTRNPAELKPHPLFATTHHPMMSKESPQWQALVENIRQVGLLQPVIITEDGLLMDGRHRHAAALECGLDSIPCIIRPAEEAPLIIAESLLHRRHYSKGARAYLLAPFADIAAEAGKAVAKQAGLRNLRHNSSVVPPVVSPSEGSEETLAGKAVAKQAGLRNLRHNSSVVPPVVSPSEGSEETLQKFVDEAGVGREYLRLAREVHARIRALKGAKAKDDETGEMLPVRDLVERMLFDYERGFQGILAMLGYLAAGNKAQGQALKDKRAQYGRLAKEKFEKLSDNFGTWNSVPDDEKILLWDAIPKETAKWPPEVCQRLYVALAKRRDEWAGN